MCYLILNFYLFLDDNWTTSTHELATSTVYHSFLQDVANLNEELQGSKRNEGHLDDLKEVLLVSAT